jgi:hypothetical protein
MLEINNIFNIRKIPLNTTPSYGSVSIGFDAIVTSVHGGAVHLSSSTLSHAVVPRRAAPTSRAALGLRVGRAEVQEEVAGGEVVVAALVHENLRQWGLLDATDVYVIAQLTSRVSSGFLTAIFTVPIATSSIPAQASTRGTTRSWRMSDILHSR